MYQDLPKRPVIWNGGSITMITSGGAKIHRTLVEIMDFATMCATTDIFV